MKINSLFHDADGGPSRLQELAWRWGAALFGQPRDGDRSPARRPVAFALDARSLCRIDGNVRGLRIDCRQGRLWLTQAGAGADVILQPGQGFVAGGSGAIVVQPVPAWNAPEETALGTFTVSAAQARLKIHRARKSAAYTRLGLDRAAGDRCEGASEKFSGPGVPPAFLTSRPYNFAGETPVHRRPEARATIFQTRSEWWEQLVFITLWLCSFFGVGYCLKAVLSLF